MKRREDEMLTGIITTRHIVSHPQILVESVGFRGYIFLLMRSFSHRKYFLVDLIMERGMEQKGGGMIKKAERGVEN